LLLLSMLLRRQSRGRRRASEKLPRGLLKTRASCEVSRIAALHVRRVTFSLSTDVRSSMAAQMHALTGKLAEAQRQLELQHQVQRDSDVAASAAAAAAVAAQRDWIFRVASAASEMAAVVSPLLSDAAELRATQQVTTIQWFPFCLHFVNLYPCRSYPL
jgi:hypothetical protein